MKKYTQKELKNLINLGLAKDVTRAQSREDIPENYTQIGYSAGVYGCNGMLLKGLETGQLYAVAGRTTTVFIF